MLHVKTPLKPCREKKQRTHEAMTNSDLLEILTATITERREAMLMTAIFPIVMALLGAAAYLLSANPKVVELGRLLFAAGVFALAFVLAGKTLAI